MLLIGRAGRRMLLSRLSSGGRGKNTYIYTQSRMVVRGVLSEWHPARGFPPLDVDEMLAATAR